MFTVYNVQTLANYAAVLISCSTHLVCTTVRPSVPGSRTGS